MSKESVIDTSTEFGERAARRLREEQVVWLTTVTRKGAPLPGPVGFLWDGADSVLVYSQDSWRIRNISANPRVTLNFDGDGQGGNIVILSGEARVDAGAPSASENPAYVAKYGAGMAMFGGPEAFAARFKVPVRIELTGLRGR
ncbi:MAG: TIGR03667 family PPOX class F420-dependent oxidoreductase [Solirubrobacterales bacterium]|nr:TIGR03667 family PPOX class F420-dependent oxidoreductase [Solirubrobacterales bacterium]